ncbi:MAG: T9SS type A sorting domain-containing protein [Prevotella sp.]|jgi:hypothetical protein|nr:T9SS type A sorting domain-containing protein [Prevotella sp.]
MKLRLGLVILLFLPLLMKGQSTPESTVFYSKGKMHVKFRAGTGDDIDGSKSKSTTLYVKGSAEFADGSGIVQLGRTELTGDFINGKDPDATGVDVDYLNLFKDPTATANAGVIAFIGVDNKQTIRRSDALLALLKGSQKNKNYIAFPTLRIEKTTSSTLDPRQYGFVAVDSSAAVVVNNLVAPLNAANALGTSRFVVEGGYDNTAPAPNPQKLNIGQALIINDGEITSTGVNTDLLGYSQMNLTMYKYSNTEDDGSNFGANHEVISVPSGGNTLRNGDKKNYLTGFTPPFKELGNDYFMYHVLMKPDQTSLTSGKGTIQDPNYKMKAGLGYFMTMDLTDYDNDIINYRWSAPLSTMEINEKNRARGGFEFSRRLLAQHFNAGGVANPNSTNYMKDFTRFTANPGDVKAGGWSGIYVDWPDFGRDRIEYIETEKFTVTDVDISLERGLNFLGNPFMAPISLNPLLGLGYNNVMTVTDPSKYAGVDVSTNFIDVSELFGTGVKASLDHNNVDNIIRSKYWVVNTALIHYSANKYHMTVNYDYVSTDGTTAVAGIGDRDNTTKTINDPANFLIAPMQMFILQTNKAFDIKLSPKLRTFGTTRFLKNASANSSLLSDFFVVEVASTLDNTADRTAVVLRDGAQMESTDLFDTTKSFTTAITEPDPENKNSKSEAVVYPEQGSTYVYTKSSDGNGMLGNAVPLNVKELALYVTPPATQQTMKLNFINLENVTAVSNVWLIDKYENNKTVKLTPGYVYEYSSGPSDLRDVAENRFILRFYGDNEDIIKEESPITCYYNTSILHILGLNENDLDSSLQIFDMQGRLVGKTTINNYPSFEYPKSLSLGTYIVKISGKRNFTAKFVNLQN